MATPTTSTASLHDEAVQAEKHLEALSTGLAQAGASPDTVKAVTQMAEVTRQIVSALGKGSEHAPDEQPEAAPPSHRPGSSSGMDQAAAETQAAMAAKQPHQ